MPLARIITRHPDSTSSLFQQLQWLGYAVEIRTPEEVCDYSADLEVEFEVYSRDAALQRAAELAASLNTGVTVAPGALEFVRQTVVEEAVPEFESAAIDTREKLARPAEEIFAMQQAEEPLALPEPIHQADASLPAMKWVAEPEPMAQEMPEALHRYEAEESGPGRFARFADGVQTTSQGFLRGLRAMLFSVGRGAKKAGRTLKAAAVFVPAAVYQSAQKYGERRRIHPVELSAGGPKASKRSYFRPQLRSAFTGAACASALFILGMVLAGFHPRSPLPESVSRTVAPGATVETGGVTLQSTGTQTGVAAQQAVTQPPATANHPVQSTHSAAASPSRHRVRRRGVSESDDDVTVDDVIVRHYPHHKAASRPQQASLKHYSDLDR